MGLCIVPQNDGLYCLFSTYSDTIVGTDLSATQVEDYFARAAAREERDRVRKFFERLESHDLRVSSPSLSEALERHAIHAANCEDPEINAWVKEKT